MITFYNQNIFICVICITALLGFITKVIVNGNLNRLIRISRKISETKNNYICNIRGKYETGFKLNLRINNVDTFVDKYITRYRIGFIPVRTFELFSIEAIIICVSTGLVGAFYLAVNNALEYEIAKTLIVSIVVSSILISLENFFRVEYKLYVASNNIKDYLENTLLNRLEQEENKERVKEQRAEASLERTEERHLAQSKEQEEIRNKAILKRKNLEKKAETQGNGSNHDLGEDLEHFKNCLNEIAITKSKIDGNISTEEKELIEDILKDFLVEL